VILLTLGKAALFLSAAGMSWSLGDADQAHYKHPTVCAVLAKSAKYRASYIAIDAEVLADGRHGIILTDNRCEGQALPLDYPQPSADKSVADFEKVVTSSGSPGTVGRQITGSFIGKVRRDPVSKKISYSLLSVTNLDVRTSPGK
jgi:hypothetical protein